MHPHAPVVRQRRRDGDRVKCNLSGTDYGDHRSFGVHSYAQEECETAIELNIEWFTVLAPPRLGLGGDIALQRASREKCRPQFATY